MNIVVNLLFWLHLLALVGGGGSAVAMPIIGSKLATADGSTRQTLFEIAGRISKASRGALGGLIVTGILLFWLKWNFSAPSMIWFGIKMALVLVLLGAVIVGGINFKKAQQGNGAAARTAMLAGRISGLALVGVILAAVFAFSSVA
jgi:protoporphyrinogen IX oxidase